MTLHKIIKLVLALVVVTLIFAAIYLTAQQNYRQSADDPQIQLAEDAVVALNKGAIPQWNATNQIDAGASLSPFIIIYDASGTPAAASGLIGGVMPTPPIGVFDSAKEKGEDRVSWQTSGGLRYAAVIVPWSKGYVLAARSLREVEKREAMLNVQVGAPWVLSLILVAGFFFLKRKA